MGLFGCGKTRDYLKDFGFGTIRLPREGIKPLMMMIKNGNQLTPLGQLAVTFKAGSQPLPIAVRQRSAPVSGSKSKSTDIDIGLSILGNVIGALAGSSLGLKAAYKNARKVQFEFSDVMQEAVDINQLDAFLSFGSVAPEIGNFVKQTLDAEQVYVITSTLDAKQISVEATREDGSSVGLDVPVIQQIVGGKIAVSGSGTNNSKITYASTDVPLSFGLQVLQLIFKNGKYSTLKEVSPGAVASLTESATPKQPAPRIEGPGLRIEI